MTGEKVQFRGYMYLAVDYFVSFPGGAGLKTLDQIVSNWGFARLIPKINSLTPLFTVCAVEKKSEFALWWSITKFRVRD